MTPAVGGGDKVPDKCAVCGDSTKKQCARCKKVKYCSEACQITHWEEHKPKCKDSTFIQTFQKVFKNKVKDGKASLVTDNGNSRPIKNPNQILFPYEEFINFFEWDRPDYPPPCGLLNCGNSCFANVVLQCLAYTRPLVAYLLEKGHKTECQMDHSCFFCEFQTHVERATRSTAPFSPINILSRLPNIGGNLDFGQQEDAHEFMRFAIDTMQSVCLDEFGGEKAVHPSYQQTTLIQHIFGGRLRSQVVCTECNNVSNQFENMMDLTVEIHGDAETLEECLDQFTAKEQLNGDNKYKCDGCNAYVTAWKRLTIQQAPNILTIALKRFQSGRFGKLNKRVTFPEKLNLTSYMSELEFGNDYVLYAVIVHLDMLNASFFGHYICYVKGFCGNWFRIDDCEVTRVHLNEVVSQGAYMLLYKRVHARPSCLLPAETFNKLENGDSKKAVDISVKQIIHSSAAGACLGTPVDSENCSGPSVNIEISSIANIEDPTREVKIGSAETCSSTVNGGIHNFEAAPKKVGSLNDASELIPVSTSLIGDSSMELDASNVAPFVSDTKNPSEGNRCKADGGSHRILTDEMTSAANCKIGEGMVSYLSPMTTCEIRDVNSSNGSSTPGNTVNSNETSGIKLKPVFVPGFLGKHPQRRPKQKKKVVVEAKLLQAEHINMASKLEEIRFLMHKN
ncbi:ubiquitin carboxyl-terminal hydrolase 18-like isoform X2 [Andrographis paniculata]|nr:ubiquitin carboxyl-terminal hydrolase 18-like isoform X2 [Andrographis paniculata]